MTTVSLDGMNSLKSLILPPYQIPDGYYDVPFCFVWNPPFFGYSTSDVFFITIQPPVIPPPWINTQNGSATETLLNQTVLIDNNCDYILRAVALPSDLCGQFQLYTPTGERVFGQPIACPALPAPTDAIPEPKIVPILPELVYPAQGAIRFDLLNLRLVRNNVVDPADGGLASIAIGTGQLVFYGVKRFRGWNRYPAVSDRPYKEVNYTYRCEFNFDFTNVTYTEITVHPNASISIGEQDTTFRVPITNFDFELRRIQIQVPQAGSYVADPLSTDPSDQWNAEPSSAFEAFRLQFYDAVENPLSGGGNGTAVNTDNGMSPKYWAYKAVTSEDGFDNEESDGLTLPCPPVLYPRDGQIRIDVMPLISAQLPPVDKPVVILLHGVQRMPC